MLVIGRSLRESGAPSGPAEVESRTLILTTRSTMARSGGAARSPVRRSGRGSTRAFTVEALWAIKRIGSPTLSPDGSTACAAVTRFDMESNESATELWLFSTQGGKPRRLTSGDKDTEPRWSPDGRWIAFTAKRSGDDEPQLYIIAPDGGEARRLTKLATGCACVKWFRDSKRIAFVSAVWPDLRTESAQAKRRKESKQSKLKVHATERAEYRFWDHWLTDGREPHVMICDIASGRTQDVLAGTGLALPPWE